MILVSTHELENSLSGNAKLIDASWHFLSNRNGFKEYQKEHIENAIFFDLEKHSGGCACGKVRYHSIGKMLYQ